MFLVALLATKAKTKESGAALLFVSVSNAVFLLSGMLLVMCCCIHSCTVMLLLSFILNFCFNSSTLAMADMLVGLCGSIFSVEKHSLIDQSVLFVCLCL